MEKSKICKRNMKLFPTYRILAVDFLFFYTINILFLTQTKCVPIADVVFVEALYSLFVVIWQIPATIIVGFIGRKNSIILGNFLNCIYLVLIFLSHNIFNLIIAELICGFAFALKEIGEPSLLNDSIPATNAKSKIFAKLNGKGMSGYYFLNALSILLSGFLFELNNYIPITLAFIMCFIGLLISLLFRDPVISKTKNSQQEKEETTARVTIKTKFSTLLESFKFIFISKRLRSLILFSTAIYGFLCVIASYEVSLLEELNVSSSYIGIIFASLGIITGLFTRKQDSFHNKYKNKSLRNLGLAITLSCLIAGLFAYLKLPLYITIIVIILTYLVKNISTGFYYILIDKYLRNFANNEIDEIIFSAKSLFNSISSLAMGIVASLLLEIMNTAQALIILSSAFVIILVVILIYIKNKLGLSANQYSEEELRFEEIGEPSNETAIR